MNKFNSSSLINLGEDVDKIINKYVEEMEEVLVSKCIYCDKITEVIGEYNNTCNTCGKIICLKCSKYSMICHLEHNIFSLICKKCNKLE